ncbi:MAG: gamma carbonic anhydrase family protein [Planctomycetes bacterium]|nr:gamma carbonic anhydrase family protein [Planctomycetota bacterium]
MAFIHNIPHQDGELIPQDPAFLAPNASLIGDVRFGTGCSIWFGAVLRGDINYISLGNNCNVQDNCVLHVNINLPCILGNNVTLGHQATAHACTIKDGVLLGMGSRVLDGAVIGEGSIIAAGCVVPPMMQVPAHSLVAGVPGKIIKILSAEQQHELAQMAPRYLEYQKLYPELCRDSSIS